jgi:hypothetical protein
VTVPLRIVVLVASDVAMVPTNGACRQIRLPSYCVGSGKSK